MNENSNYYAILPAIVRYDENLSDKAKLLYAEITALCSKYNECWASNAYFARLYHCSERTITRLITELKDCRYISVELIYKSKEKEIDKRVLKLNSPYRQNCLYPIDKNVYTPIDKNVQDNNTSMNNTSNNKPPIIPQKPNRKIINNLWELQFNNFWKIYPKKLKKDAAREWFKKRTLSNDEYTTIISKLKLFVKTKQWKKNDGEFIPHAITWLNQKRWEDEIPKDEIEETKEEENARILAEIEAENDNRTS